MLTIWKRICARKSTLYGFHFGTIPIDRSSGKVEIRIQSESV